MEAVTGEIGVDEGPVERGIVPDDEGDPVPVRLPAEGVKPKAVGVYTDRAGVELLMDAVTGETVVDEADETVSVEGLVLPVLLPSS